MKSVAGSYHQGNALIFFYNNAGYQCRPVALAAFFAVSEWGTQDVDQILLYSLLLFSNVKYFIGIKEIRYF